MEKLLKGSSFCTFSVYALIAQLALAQAGNVVPVMLWSGEFPSSLINPLHKTSRPEFEAILAERLSKYLPPIIIFVKDNFCIEDISHHKKSLQELNNAGSLTYFTSVESALSVFENLLSYNITTEDELESVNEGQLIMMQVNDLNAIPEIYNMVRESSPNLIVAVTGKSCGYYALERIKRAADSGIDTQPLIINETRILFYADKLPSITIDGKNIPLSNLTYSSVNADINSVNLTMIFTSVGSDMPSKISLVSFFNKTSSAQYFTFIGMVYQPDGKSTEEKFLRSKSDITFPVAFSYHCSSESLFLYKNKSAKNDEVSVKFYNMQVQMNVTKFGASYSCVGFTTIPIWTGIFVTAILALIMIWGLTMIMDIRTMDRFDDPKGKTITVSAQE